LTGQSGETNTTLQNTRESPVPQYCEMEREGVWGKEKIRATMQFKVTDLFRKKEKKGGKTMKERGIIKTSKLAVIYVGCR